MESLELDERLPCLQENVICSSLVDIDLNYILLETHTESISLLLNRLFLPKSKLTDEPKSFFSYLTISICTHPGSTIFVNSSMLSFYFLLVAVGCMVVYLCIYYGCCIYC